MSRLNPKAVVFIHVVILIVLGLAVYCNSIGGKFIWDDLGLVKDNVYIKDWKYLPAVIQDSFGSGAGTASNYYRPLQTILHMAGYSLWGLDVRGYHLTSILFHILAAVAFYFFIRILSSRTDIPFLASLFFLVHPVNTETVCYISGVNDSLALFFILLCLIFYLKSFDSHAFRYGVLSVLSLAMALLSKENALIVPVLILFYHCAFKKNRIMRAVPLFALVMIYVLFRVTLLSPLVFPDISLPVLLKGVFAFFASCTMYLRLLFFPFDLRVEYGDMAFGFGDLRVIAGMLLIFSLAGVAFLRRKKSPLLFFSLAWFLVALLPVSNIIPVNLSFMMEHWLYMPSLGFFTILSSALCLRPKSRNAIFSLRAFSVALLVFYSFLTFRQNGYWSDPVVFYNRTLKYAPDSWRFYNELGLEYENRAMYEQALAAFKKSLEIKPDLTGVYYNLANLYRKISRQKDAYLAVSKAEETNRKLAKEYYERGRMYADRRQDKKAAALYAKALELDHQNQALRLELANSYIITGRYEQAITLLLEVTRVDPASALAYNNLAVAYYYAGEYDSAVSCLGKAIEFGYPVSREFLRLMGERCN
ncbi:MAG: tetratricopeptide repeat protein [Candidatus Omnitrophica bacterium]|nr:tetratricopeptide repeat protein [Candidatus Omnitrophota bacterium]